MLDVEFTQLSDLGRTREHNEDYLGYLLPYMPEQLRSHGCVFALADGVGGQAKGEVAAQLAVETRAGWLHRARSRRAARRAAIAPRASCEPASAMNRAVHLRPRPDMATTIVASALRVDRAVIAHVGDSRCYLVRDGRARIITRDHTVAAEQVRLGVLSAADAALNSRSTFAEPFCGNDMLVVVEIDEVQLQKGDLLLQCSDGLHGSVLPDDIASVLARSDNLHTAAEKMVALANERDGKDNISVQLIRVHDVERIGMYRGRPYALR